jgi:hypothetical protein
VRGVSARCKVNLGGKGKVERAAGCNWVDGSKWWPNDEWWRKFWIGSGRVKGGGGEGGLGCTTR